MSTTKNIIVFDPKGNTSLLIYDCSPQQWVSFASKNGANLDYILVYDESQGISTMQFEKKGSIFSKNGYIGVTEEDIYKTLENAPYNGEMRIATLSWFLEIIQRAEDNVEFHVWTLTKDDIIYGVLVAVDEKIVLKHQIQQRLLNVNDIEQLRAVLEQL